MADTLHLQIITPDKLLVREDVETVQIPGKNGYLGILPGHAPLITELTIGEISYTQGGTTQYLAVAWGFAEVLPDKVTILADVAERAEDIDVKRAQEAKAKADEAFARPVPISTTMPCSMRSAAPKCVWKLRHALDSQQPRTSKASTQDNAFHLAQFRLFTRSYLINRVLKGHGFSRAVPALECGA